MSGRPVEEIAAPCRAFAADVRCPRGGHLA
jgi:hypothetical protein